MKITIGKKTYESYFGFRFLDEINRRLGMTVEVEGQTINTRTGGINFLEVGLGGYEPNVLISAILACTVTSVDKPTTKEVETHVEHLILEDLEAYQALCEGILDEVKKNALLKNLMVIQEKLNEKKKEVKTK